LGLIVAVPLLAISAGAFGLAGVAWINAPDPALDWIAIIELPRGHVIFSDPNAFALVEGRRSILPVNELTL
jgi:hypothetical protein